MIRPERILPNRQRASLERLRSCDVAAGLDRSRQVVQGGSNEWMFRPQSPFPDLESALMHRLGSLILTLLRIDQAEKVEREGEIGILGCLQSFLSCQRAFGELSRLVIFPSEPEPFRFVCR